MTTYIYESPDGGDTIYRREMGTTVGQRELHSISESKKRWDHRMARRARWEKILDAGDQDAVLKNMLDEVEIYHDLKSQPYDS